MSTQAEINLNDVFGQFNLRFDSELISNQIREEVDLLIKLNKINTRNPISSRIYLSMLAVRFYGFPNLKITCYALLGRLLGYRI